MIFSLVLSHSSTSQQYIIYALLALLAAAVQCMGVSYYHTVIFQIKALVTQYNRGTSCGGTLARVFSSTKYFFLFFWNGSTRRVVAFSCTVLRHGDEPLPFTFVVLPYRYFDGMLLLVVAKRYKRQLVT